MRPAVPASLMLIMAMLLAAPGLFAQRGGGGGHAGGGHSFGGSSFSGHSFGGGFSSASRSFSSMPSRNWSSPQRSFSSGFSAPRFSAAARSPYFGRMPAAGYRRPGTGSYADRRPRYRSPYHTYGTPYGYGSAWLSPWELGYPDFAGYPDAGGDDSADVQGAPAEEYPAESSGNAPDDDYRPGYRSGYMSAPSASAAPAPEPLLTVVFRDGHTKQIRNYALTHSTLIVLDDAASGRQQRISLDQIDLAATERSAQDAGLDFHPPSA